MGLGTFGGPMEAYNRLYATVYKPEDGDPADFDEEAHTFPSKIFSLLDQIPMFMWLPEVKKTTFDDG